LILSSFIQEFCCTFGAYGSFLDQEVAGMESLTGEPSAAIVPRNMTTIDQYPPLFDRLQSRQQGMRCTETNIAFQVRLIRFLKEQHTILVALRQARFSGREQIQIKVQAQKVVDSFNFSLSQMENMLVKVQMLSLRLRVQLRIVESRLNQSNRRTPVAIAEETKRAGMPMRTVAALTMLFLPGMFTAVSIPPTPQN